ncbi:MAG: Coenzyme F420 hydrogenase subunit beta [Promethearchaeota archaeon]|nr:MAG: Coenzyme F420 hydrogenase subunit beta [Candidatus Lokiarchaeota archaeon]
MCPKTFQDLISEVHKKGICQECGGCVSFCSAADFDIIAFKTPHSPPDYIHKEKCLECGICYYICPQTHILNEELTKEYGFLNYSSMPIGHYCDIYSCQATDVDFLKHGTDGGVVNSILFYLIEQKLIDGSIVSKAEVPFAREAFFADSKEGLLKASGTQLYMAPHLQEIEKFSTYTHTISELNHYKFKKLAIVGTPCQIYTIRCMQHLGVTPSENVEFCMGLLCYENFFFDKTESKKFQEEFNISFEEIDKLNIKEDVILTLKLNNGSYKRISLPFNHLNDYVRQACKACTDFSNIYADISFGGLASPQNYTTVITRTKKGEEIFQNALRAGIIKALDLTNNKKAQMVNLIAQYSTKKVERKSKYMKKIINGSEKNYRKQESFKIREKV